MKHLCPDISVESKNNNSELVKAVKNLEDTDNKYVIVFDNSFDNLVAYDVHIKEHNIECLAAKLLFDLTRNTGFEVSKGSIGECWTGACCEWEGRKDDDVCGLYSNRLSVYAKMRSIYEETCLKAQFYAAGIEVADD